MPKQFLDCPDVVTVFQQMCGEGMAEGMRACGLGDPSFHDRLLDRALHHGFVQVVPALLSRDPVDIMACRWKDPLPRPLFARIRVFTLEGVGQGNTPQPFPEICLVPLFDGLEVSEKRLFDSGGQDRIAILVPLAAPNDYLVPKNVNVFDS